MEARENYFWEVPAVLSVSEMNLPSLRKAFSHIQHLDWRTQCAPVLGLARTGLIFTGLQEGAQPGGGG